MTGCPLIGLGAEVWQLLECAVLFAKGLPPVAGGSLDQSGWFLAASAVIAAEKNYWKGKSDGKT